MERTTWPRPNLTLSFLRWGHSFSQVQQRSFSHILWSLWPLKLLPPRKGASALSHNLRVLSLLETDYGRGRNASVRGPESEGRGIQLHSPLGRHSPGGQESWLLVAASGSVTYLLERLFELVWKYITCPGRRSSDQHLHCATNSVNQLWILVVWQNFSKQNTIFLPLTPILVEKTHFMIPKLSTEKTFWFFTNSQVFLWPHSITKFSPTAYGKTWKVTTSAVKVMAMTATQTFFCCTVIFYTEVFNFWSKVTYFYKQKHFHTLNA